MKKTHARLGVCLDHRLEMSLNRALVIVKDVVSTINAEINTVEGHDAGISEDSVMQERISEQLLTKPDIILCNNSRL